MNRKPYEVPSVESLELNVESGIAVSASEIYLQQEFMTIDGFNDQEEW